ncbi:hypothetical protein CSA56_01210 [candidate division KSB3 bacterium]|uniref:ADP-dependent glucokinase n=1 Tax=candidate division KSB3 bacterium TaxID=2044937 RepID=A0A2G6KKD2_9BACT|nr:MAG: hypothetical protein CSA56_01210 [candidate division KSB3 bacterium]
MENHMTAEHLDTLLKQRLKSNRWYCTGLGNNVDEEIEWERDVVQDLLAEYFPSANLPTRIPEEIATPEDFLILVVALFRQGKGMELPLVNEGVCRFLEQHFQCQRTLGGTGARSARALATLGLRVFVNLNILSETVRRLLDLPTLYTIVGSEMIRLRDAADLGEESYAPHFIVQYSEGDELQIGRETICCPQSNRIILPYDEINTIFTLNSSYFHHVSDMGNHVASIVISGFNSMSDEALLLSRLQEVESGLNSIRAQNIPIYLEDAGYHKPAYKQHVLRQLGPMSTIFGMNEDELADIVRLHHHRVDINDLQSVLNGLECVFEQYPVRNIVVHTKDFALYYGHDRRQHDIAAGLVFANALASTRARIGRDGTCDDLHQTLALPESSQGKLFQQQAQKTISNRYLVVSPARCLDQPACTIGLGDTFVAGFQIGFSHP